MTTIPILEIKDLEKLAQKKVPKMFFDYVNSGSWTETTYNENVSDFQKIKLRQRVAIDMSNRTLETKMIGQKVAMPMAIAPTGLTGMQRADGEILAAQAAEEGKSIYYMLESNPGPGLGLLLAYWLSLIHI